MALLLLSHQHLDEEAYVQQPRGLATMGPCQSIDCEDIRKSMLMSKSSSEELLCLAELTIPAEMLVGRKDGFHMSR